MVSSRHHFTPIGYFHVYIKDYWTYFTNSPLVLCIFVFKICKNEWFYLLLFITIIIINGSKKRKIDTSSAIPLLHHRFFTSSAISLLHHRFFFCGVHGTLYSIYCLEFSQPLFLLLSFYLWPLYCLLFFDLRIPYIPAYWYIQAFLIIIAFIIQNLFVLVRVHGIYYSNLICSSASSWHLLFKFNLF